MDASFLLFLFGFQLHSSHIMFTCFYSICSQNSLVSSFRHRHLELC